MKRCLLFVLLAGFGLVHCVGDDAPTPSSSGTDAGSSGTSGTSGGGSGTKLAFVTRGLFDGKLASATGGVEAGDAICNAEAMAPGRKFAAWLSDGGHNAIDRIGAGPWQLKNATVIGGKDKLLAGSVVINLDAQGGAVDDKVWTGTGGDGKVAAAGHCNAWTNAVGGTPPVGVGVYGTASAPLATWTNEGTVQCSEAHHIYCFEL